MKRSLTIFMTASGKGRRKKAVRQCLINNVRQDIVPKKLVKAGRMASPAQVRLFFFSFYFTFIWVAPREQWISLK